MLALLAAVRTAGRAVAVGDGIGVAKGVGLIEADGRLVEAATEGTAVRVVQPEANMMALAKTKVISRCMSFSPCFYSNLIKKGKSFDDAEWENGLGVI